MSETPNLKLPYLAAAQSQKHVTHNEALRTLDAVVQLAVLDRDAGAPPASPVQGDRYIIAASPSGAWAGHAGNIAAWQDGTWTILSPAEGWLAWVADENTFVVFDGTAWDLVPGSGGGGGGGSPTNLTVANRTATTLDVASSTGTDATLPAATTSLSGVMAAADKTKLDGVAAGADVTPAALQTRTMVGINATADATNRLSVAAPATLLNHEGAGHQVKVNKAAAADTASFLFQTAFSGRAEMGTTGDDDFHFKVSPDGTTWLEALLIDKTTGAVSFPQALKLDKADLLALTEITSIDNAADFLFLETAGGLRRKVKPVNLGLGGGGGGEANTGSNVGTAGIGVFKVKSGVDLQFRNVDAGSSKIQVALDAGTNRIVVDLGAVAIADVGGLQTALDGKAANAHAHGTAGLTDGAVTYAKLQNVSATARLLGRKTAGAGVAEELTLSEVLDLVGSAAQGDLLYRGASGWSRIAAGTSGMFLKTLGSGADPIWDTPSGGGGGSSNFAESPPGHSPAFGALSSGALRGAQLGLSAIGNAAMVANRLYLIKVHFEKARTLTGLGLRVNTAGGAGTVCRLGIYEMSEDGLPTTLLLDAGTVATDSTGHKEITISQAVANRPYYVAALFEGTPSCNSGATNLPLLGFTASSAAAVAYLYRAFTFGTLPSDETGSAGTYTAGVTHMPLIFWK